jgi:hypothetical protein
MTNGQAATLSGGRQRTATTPTAADFLRGARGPLSVTFVRRLDVPFETAVDRFDQWWRVGSRGEVIDVAGSRLVGPPKRGDGGGERRVGVLLGRRSLHAPLRMDLQIVRWSASFGTTIELLPLRRLHPGQGYFRDGHLLLDRVTAAVST